MKNNTYLEIMNNVSAAYRAYEKDHTEDTSAGLTVGQWLEEYKGMMVACVRPWLTSLKKHGYELEDLLQEASIVVLGAWESYDSNRSGILSGTYFWKVITNAMCDLYRACNAQKRTAVQVFSLAEVNELIDFDNDEVLSATPVPPVMDDSMEGYVSLRMDLDKLTAIQRTIMSLREQGYTVPEVARKVGLSTATVKRAIKKARDILA